jgi:hypothetical protein
MHMLKHLPVTDWPDVDRDVFTPAYQPGDVFDDTAGPGAHLSNGSRMMIRSTYRRWLGFLKAKYPDDLSISPAERITLERVRAFIEDLAANIRPSSVAIAAARLYDAARLIAPKTDWSWLRSLKSRLASCARAMDRFDRLVPPVHTLNFGIELMDTALMLPTSDGKQRAVQYRDGLLLALLSLWSVRRRSIAALTVSRHLEFDDADMNILLHSADTKAKRAESFRVPEQLLPYIMHYLKEIRPLLLIGGRDHDGFWASCRGTPLSADRIYAMVRARVIAKFGKAMGLHDFRRAGPTFLAMDAPEKIGLIPGILQHASPKPGEQHYNISRSVQASRRFAEHLANARKRLRPLAAKSASMRAETVRWGRPIHITMEASKHRDRGEPSCA